MLPLVLLLWVVLPAGAQTTSGKIAGSVLDSSGAAIPNASIRALNRETGAALQTTPTSGGVYSLYPLPTGLYDVTVSAAGFQTLRVTEIRLDVAATLARDFVLEVARVETSVTVSSDSVPVLSQTPTIESTVLREQIDTLPLNGRDFNQLVTLAAGAVDNNVGGGTDFGAVG